MSVITCWQCGAKPLRVVEVTSPADAQPRFLPGHWPAGDHMHAADPPTPSELLADADAIRARMLRDLAP